MGLRLFFLLLSVSLLCCCADGTSEFQKQQTASADLTAYNSLKELAGKSFSNDSVAILAAGLRNDSLRNELYFDYSYSFYKQRDSLNFSYWNKKAHELAVQLRDTSKIAESYWDLGNFYYRSNASDSAYYYYSRASELYEVVQEDFMVAKMLLNMAIVQKNIKEYSASEVTTIRALEKFKHLGKDKQLYSAYNNLGIIHNELGNYEQSLGYHQEAIARAEKLKDVGRISSSLNNTGVVLYNKKDYAGAVEKYQAALLADSLFHINTPLYAMLKDNLAHAKLKLNDTTGVEALYLEALRIRDSIDHSAGIAVNKVHLAEFYLSRGDSLRARDYAMQAQELARENRSFGHLLESQLLLARIDPINSGEYLTAHIRLNDSLQQRERTVRDKFARIRFETDEFIAKNEQLTAQRNWVIGGSTGAIFILGLLIVVVRQKARHKGLLYEKEQQTANEEIYKLLLDQEERIEKVRRGEKERISRELHDGVLGTMYGIRFRLTDLNSRYDKASVETREDLLNRLRITEEEIRSFSHKLQTKELLKESGFIQLLALLLAEQEEVLGFRPALKYRPDIPWDRIDSRVKMNLYRIVQEAVHNTRKYAFASALSVVFEMKGSRLRLGIKDNGKGFDVDKRSRGVGIKNMKSRVNDLNGEFRILSGTGGTGIEILIPVKHEREEKNTDDRRSSSDPGRLQKQAEGAF